MCLYLGGTLRTEWQELSLSVPSYLVKPCMAFSRLPAKVGGVFSFLSVLA